MATTIKHLSANSASGSRNLVCDADSTHLLILDQSVDSVDITASPIAQYAAFGQYAFQNSQGRSLADMNNFLITARNAYAGLTSWGRGYCKDLSSNDWRLPMISGMGLNFNPTMPQATYDQNHAWFAVGGVAQHYLITDKYRVNLCRVKAAKMVLSQCTCGRYDVWQNPIYFAAWGGDQYTDGGPFVYYHIADTLKTPAQAYAAGADGSFSILSAAQSDFGWDGSDPWKSGNPWAALDYFNVNPQYTENPAFHPSTIGTYSRWTHFRWSTAHEFSLSAAALSKISSARGDFWLHAWIVSPFVYTNSSYHPGWNIDDRDFSSAIVNGMKLTCAWDI